MRRHPCGPGRGEPGGVLGRKAAVVSVVHRVGRGCPRCVVAIGEDRIRETFPVQAMNGHAMLRELYATDLSTAAELMRGRRTVPSATPPPRGVRCSRSSTPGRPTRGMAGTGGSQAMTAPCCCSKVRWTRRHPPEKARQVAEHYGGEHRQRRLYEQSAHNVRGGAPGAGGWDCGSWSCEPFSNDPTASVDTSCMDHLVLLNRVFPGHHRHLGGMHSEALSETAVSRSSRGVGLRGSGRLWLRGGARETPLAHVDDQPSRPPTEAAERVAERIGLSMPRVLFVV